MPTLALWSLIGLISIVVIVHITSFIFNILDDRFYSIFHIIGPILSVFFFYSFFNNYLISIILTLCIGILWEIFEYCEWKFILKKKKYKPDPVDTRNDLVLDFLGSLIGVLFLSLLPK
ncbi:hypothetical protein A2773_02465 [Candidatus Gottesmanbacteria bacterium RIFCSPHIGHO2_01_FULL_39_10]|uniref:VanZ-like domain-containing protein n=1 Tax=Candidatus Gottesmanbacteria bacterium RIFCSPHIGHO2_01_FULL_39_10 TaxID=1798375 RepID=A0A1F5ZRB2_9BACT|nr:MAG: hypothetical protein A2773_02465 [Candidatus Gottesmanbacteria bacterium RIFCSPHIGHO2_01_FULL_39_10]